MSITERTIAFRCEGQRLLGVLAEPAQGHDVGVVIVVGGPQVRAGSHRQFVQQARAAAAAGFPTLRFDVRGMGDSEGELRNFEHITPDIGAAIDALQQAAPGVRRVVLWGLCDGASAALLYLDQPSPDERVAGLCLLNPWVRSEETQARAQVRHYYLDRLRQPEFWRKLLRGGVAGRALRDLARNVRLASASTSLPDLHYSARMARAWQRFEGRVLLVLSAADLTAAEFVEATRSHPAWRGALARKDLERIDLSGADHTLSTPGSQAQMERAVVQWLAELASPAALQAPRATAANLTRSAHAA